jgi:hypothetical protein
MIYWMLMKARDDCMQVLELDRSVFGLDTQELDAKLLTVRSDQMIKYPIELSKSHRFKVKVYNRARKYDLSVKTAYKADEGLMYIWVIDRDEKLSDINLSLCYLEKYTEFKTILMLLRDEKHKLTHGDN